MRAVSSASTGASSGATPDRAGIAARAAAAAGAPAASAARCAAAAAALTVRVSSCTRSVKCESCSVGMRQRQRAASSEISRLRGWDGSKWCAARMSSRRCSQGAKSCASSRVPWEEKESAAVGEQEWFIRQAAGYTPSPTMRLAVSSSSTACALDLTASRSRATPSSLSAVTPPMRLEPQHCRCIRKRRMLLAS
eukprot:scaffold137923_cov31-Tisochrysis_lutea.AAC.1